MKLTTNDKQSIIDVIAYAFNKTNDLNEDPNFNSRYDHADCYGCYQGEMLTSTVMVNYFKERIFQSEVKMAGIGYIATLPEFRGLGHIQQIMAEILQDLYDQGVVLSQLAPFSERFYRQFGYENTSYRQKCTFKPTTVQQFPTEKGGRIVRGTFNDLASEIKQIYRTLLTQRTEIGSIVREDWWWQRMDSYYANRHYAVCYDDEDILSGYLIYRMEGDQFIIDECCYLNAFALRKWMTFIKAHLSSFQTFIYYTSLDDYLMELVQEQYQVQVETTPYMMTRIIDIQQLLTKIPIADELIIEVTGDTLCPWNNGIFKLQNGKIENACDDPDVSMDIHTWTQFLLGQLTLEEGLFFNQIKGRHVEKARFFSRGNQHFYDYF